MCRQRSTCTELPDAALLSRDMLLPPPQWLRDAFDAVETAFHAAAAGDIDHARELIATFPSDQTREWCREHGQGAGGVRRRLLGTEDCAPPAKAFRHTVSERLRTVVYQRDQYRCRYCGLKVITRKLFGYFGRAIGDDRFLQGRPDIERHGAQFAYGAQPEHVVPGSAGGENTANNLVTSCWVCNFGKGSHTLEELGLTDPRSRPPSTIPWDGLVSLAPALRRVAESGAA